MKAGTLLVLLALTGCQIQPTVPARVEVINTACTTFQPIRVPEADLAVISDRLKAQILAHGRAWRAACAG